MQDMKLFQIALGDACGTEHPVGTWGDWMQIELPFCRVQEARGGSQILPAILNFRQVNTPGWLVIFEFARNSEFFARSLKGIRFVAKRPQESA